MTTTPLASFLQSNTNLNNAVISSDNAKGIAPEYSRSSATSTAIAARTAATRMLPSLTANLPNNRWASQDPAPAEETGNTNAEPSNERQITPPQKPQRRGSLDNNSSQSPTMPQRKDSVSSHLGSDDGSNNNSI